MQAGELEAYLNEARELALGEIRALLPRNPRYRDVLYDLVLDYPQRQAKALRPALCIATCRALGGALEQVLRSAAILELYHNAFLIHDDIEDGSFERRNQPTLHNTHGVPIAVNVGDAMLALALEPLLDNMRTLGMGKALRILQVIARMARESAEGQALELAWIRDGEWNLTDTDYLRMVYKKTSWYTFVTPVLLGGIVAGARPHELAPLRRCAALLGMAFQIQDDVLNLTAETSGYGKEAAGDLWEGKHTLILLHAMRHARPAQRTRAQAILAKARPVSASATPAAPPEILDALVASGDLTPSGQRRLRANLRRQRDAGLKTDSDIRFLVQLIETHASLDYARGISRQYAERAATQLERAQLANSVHRDFLTTLIGFVIERQH